LEDEELMAVHEKVVQSQESLLARAVVTEEEEDSRSEPVRQIGWNYKRYRREEDLLDKAKVFYEAVAKLAGISVGTLVMAVFKIERKIMDLKKPGLDDEDAEVEDEMRTMGLGVEDSRL
jgi:RNA polymerase I-specific transcription initiation factor RRN7